MQSKPSFVEMWSESVNMSWIVIGTPFTGATGPLRITAPAWIRTYVVDVPASSTVTCAESAVASQKWRSASGRIGAASTAGDEP